MKSYLSYFHLPTVREVPKNKYLLFSDNTFGKNVYYNLLNDLRKEQEDFFPSHSTLANTKTNYMESGRGVSYNDFPLKHKNNNGQTNKNKLIYANYLLEKLGLDKRFYIFKNEDIGCINLIDKNNEIYNLANESSGLIQVMPIVMSYAIIKNDEKSKIFNLLLIEQPELHLHPRLQAKLAEVFSDSMKENSNIIVETHSEHLIRKIQVLIANGEMDKDKIGVYYFDCKDGKTKRKEMVFGDNGLFKEDWPDGFFDESIDITLELYDALRKGKN